MESPNPFSELLAAEDLSYDDFGRLLGVSSVYARKLAAGAIKTLPPRRAKDFERRTDGRLSYAALMRWVEANLDSDFDALERLRVGSSR